MATSARQLTRAVGGGLLVGLPLIFTMELWWHGFLLPAGRILVLVGLAFLIVVGYTAITGFRTETTWTEVLVDSVEALGIGVVVATVTLLLLQRIDLGTSLAEAAGKVALEAIAVAFGAAVSGAQLGEREDETGQEQRRLGPLARLFVGAGGALLFTLNVAPTEEPVLLGIEADWWMLLLVIAASYLLTLTIVFYADFRGGKSPTEGDHPLSRPLGETTSAYAISLLISLVLLWAFGRTQRTSVEPVLGEMIMLGLVASFGAAAGRLLIGGKT